MALPATIFSKRVPLTEKLRLVMEQCLAKGLRRTSSLRTILEILLAGQRPIGWAELSTNPRLLAACDPSSVFRILTRLEKLGFVHRLAAARRSYYFALDVEGCFYDQIVCIDCAHVEILSHDHPLENVTHNVCAKTGYRGVYHQLTFYGRCPRCQRMRSKHRNLKVRVDSQ